MENSIGISSRKIKQNSKLVETLVLASLDGLWRSHNLSMFLVVFFFFSGIASLFFFCALQYEKNDTEIGIA